MTTIGPYRVAVIGAGAIGCYVGTRLAAGGCDVTFLGRGWLQEAAATGGLSAQTMDGNRVALAPGLANVVTTINDVGSADVYLVCTKSDDTPAIAADLSKLLAKSQTKTAQVVSLQNGLDNTAVLQAHLADADVYPGMVAFNVVSKNATSFAATTEGGIHLPNNTVGRTLAGHLQNAEIDCALHDDIEAVQFAKLILNLNNALNALSGLPLVDQLSDPKWRRVLAACMDEALQVAKALGIKPARIVKAPVGLIPTILRLPTFLFTRLAAQMLKVDPAARSSMAEDFEKGRRPEIDHLNGKIVQLGKALGVATPVNERVTNTVSTCFEGKLTRPVDPLIMV
ncbi:MAG: 2-dehydropantoate 2-reductase [Pseudomonadota bacterium]